MKTDEQNKGFKKIYDFVLGRLPSHPRPHVTRGPRVGPSCNYDVHDDIGGILWTARPAVEQAGSFCKSLREV